MTEGNGMWNSVMELVNGGFVLDIVAILDGIKETFLIVYIVAICGYSGVNYGDGELFRNSSNLLLIVGLWKIDFFFFSIIDIIYVSIFGWSFLGYFYLLIFIFEALYNLVFLFLIRWSIHSEKCNKITRL